jgi:hypothetical protein
MEMTMYTATTAPTAPAPPKDVGTRRMKPTFADIGARLAGLGAIGFVAVVALQNILRGASAPANGASGEEVLAYYADHRPTTFVLVATFVLSAAALATFLGGAMRRLLAGNRPGWAITGCVGAAGVMALFAVVVAAEQALSVVATGDQPDLGAIEALWAFHSSVFTVLELLLAIALLGLARAGVAADLTPRAFELLAPVGAGLLALGAIAGPAIAAGDAMPVFGLAFLGFAVWLAFLVSTGLRLVRIDRNLS